MWGLFWLVAVAGIIFLLRRRHAAADPTARALSLVAERYAQGEIDADEYQERLALLRESRQRP
jgi:putative membrane protein